MSVIHSVSICAALLSGCATASAQFVKGNEAVKVMPDGSKKVETPPLPSVALGTPCPAAKPGCAAGGWKMLESTEGLVECTEVFARPTTCRASTYGSEKRSRSWIVKRKGEWSQCERPDIAGKCVSLKNFPISAVQ
jgi:hypothetical protein